MARDPVDELYEAPPREFVATRTRIAKPKATVWAINRIAHTSPKAVREVLDAFDRVTATLDTHRRIATTLRGAAASARGALLRGALTQEVAPGGFELFEGATPRGRLRVVQAEARAAARTAKKSRGFAARARRRAS